jgi:hypothetical protein
MRGLIFIMALLGCGEDYPPPDDNPDTGWPGAVVWSWSFEGGNRCPDGVVKANLYIARTISSRSSSASSRASRPPRAPPAPRAPLSTRSA